MITLTGGSGALDTSTLASDLASSFTGFAGFNSAFLGIELEEKSGGSLIWTLGSIGAMFSPLNLDLERDKLILLLDETDLGRRLRIVELEMLPKNLFSDIFYFFEGKKRQRNEEDKERNEGRETEI